MPLFYFLGAIGGGVFVIKYVLQARTERIKAAQKQRGKDTSPEGTLDHTLDDYANLLLNAGDVYPKMKEEIDKIKTKNPQADLSAQESKLKTLYWFAKHPDATKWIVAIGKPLIAKKGRQLLRGFK